MSEDTRARRARVGDGVPAWVGPMLEAAGLAPVADVPGLTSEERTTAMLVPVALAGSGEDARLAEIADGLAWSVLPRWARELSMPGGAFSPPLSQTAVARADVLVRGCAAVARVYLSRALGDVVRLRPRVPRARAAVVCVSYLHRIQHAAVREGGDPEIRRALALVWAHIGDGPGAPVADILGPRVELRRVAEIERLPPDLRRLALAEIDLRPSDLEAIAAASIEEAAAGRDADTLYLGQQRRIMLGARYLSWQATSKRYVRLDNPEGLLLRDLVTPGRSRRRLENHARTHLSKALANADGPSIEGVRTAARLGTRLKVDSALALEWRAIP